MYLRRALPGFRATPRRLAVDGVVELGAASPFSARTESWRPRVERFAGDLPGEFLMAFIDKESDGNSCSFTVYDEAGIFQLMPPDNVAQGGTTMAALRAGCSGTSQTGRKLTEAEADEQMRSGVQYVNYARDYARKRVNWPETSADFWRMVKMVHVAPARVAQFAPGTSSWAEFRRKASATTPAHWLDNAEWVGSFGAGGGSSPFVVPLIVGGALAYAVYRMLS